MSLPIRLKAGDVDTSGPHQLNHEIDHHDEQKLPWFLQITSPINQQKRGPIIEKLGHSLDAYMPENSFIVYATKKVMSELSSNPDISWIGPVSWKHKVDPAMFKSPAEQGPVSLYVLMSISKEERSTERTNEIVTSWMEKSRSDATVAESSLALNCASKDKISGTCAGGSLTAVVEFLAKQPECQWVEIAPQFKIMNAGF